MTMAVGFVCRDGIVIGADRQVTGANYTFPECKLQSVKWQNGDGIFAYSGNRDTYQDFLKEVWSRFTADAVLQYDDVRKLLRESLSAVALTKKEQFLILFGFWLDGGRPSLLVSSTPQRVVNVPECEVIGYGDSPLARSLLGRFREVPHRVSVHQASIYAISFVSQAKKYDGQFVGDGIDVYTIDATGDAGQRCVRVLDAGQTGSWENEIHLMNYWMDVLFSFATDKDNPLSIDQFVKRLDEFRGWAGGTPLK